MTDGAPIGLTFAEVAAALGAPALQGFALAAPKPQYTSATAAAAAAAAAPAAASTRWCRAGPELIPLPGGGPVSIVQLQLGAAASPVSVNSVVIKRSTVSAVRAQYAVHHKESASDRVIESRVAAVRAECSFYRLVAPALHPPPPTGGLRVPTAICAEEEDQGQITIWMECAAGFAVKDPLGPLELDTALAAAAALHGQFWQSSGGDNAAGITELLAEARLIQPGCFWTADKQDPSLEGALEGAWAGFLERCGRHLSLEDAMPGATACAGGAAAVPMADIGRRLEVVHSAVSAHLCSDALRSQTLLHGDFKLANILWPLAVDSATNPMVIDWEWVGPGPAAQDVAYLLVSSAEPSCLAAGGDERLLAAYHGQLPAAVQAAYPMADLTRDFELAILDLFRWMLRSKWSSITPSGMAEDAPSYGRILPNRSPVSAAWLVRKVARILGGNDVVNRGLQQKSPATAAAAAEPPQDLIDPLTSATMIGSCRLPSGTATDRSSSERHFAECDKAGKERTDPSTRGLSTADIDLPSDDALRMHALAWQEQESWRVQVASGQMPAVPLAVLGGLQSSPELNGEVVALQRFDGGKGRWVVRLHATHHHGKEVRVKPAALALVDAPPPCEAV